MEVTTRLYRYRIYHTYSYRYPEVIVGCVAGSPWENPWDARPNLGFCVADTPRQGYYIAGLSFTRLKVCSRALNLGLWKVIF